MTADLDFAPDSPEFRADPYQFYRQLREHSPVHAHPSGYWLLTRYQDCLLALEDPRWTYVADYGCLPAGEEPSADPGLTHGPRSVVAPAGPATSVERESGGYADTRRLVSQALTPRVASRLRPKIQAVMDDLLDRAIEAGEMNLIEAVAYPLAATVFCDLFGIPQEHRATFRTWVDAIVRGVDSLFSISDREQAERDVAGTEFREYFRGLIAERRRTPEDDLLSGLVELGDKGTLTDDELVATCVLVLIAGHESTANLLGNGTLALLRNPDQLELFKSSPEIAPLVVEEFLRYDSPAQFAVRAAREDIELDGHRIAAGQPTIVFLAAANRDPDEFDDPDRLVLTRQPNRHLAFGHGGHFCLGATLARAESRIAFTTLVQRAPRLALAGEPVYKPTFELRGLSELPVSLR